MALSQARGLNDCHMDYLWSDAAAVCSDPKSTCFIAKLKGLLHPILHQSTQHYFEISKQNSLK